MDMANGSYFHSRLREIIISCYSDERIISVQLSESFIHHFDDLIDPRVNNANLRHEFKDILVITLLAVICGADTWVDIELFGNEKFDWLQTFLSLPNGIPTHDTFSRTFEMLDPSQFESCFMNWVNSLIKSTAGEIISIDGKTLRGSHDRSNGKRAIHMISAWSQKNRMVLGQKKVDNKSNEITAIPELIKRLDITDATVTIDAMGCQKKIAELIYSRGGNYVLSVKENQGTLFKEIDRLFNKAEELEYKHMMFEQSETLDADHGRIENRKYTGLPLMYIHDFKIKWKGLNCIYRVERQRDVNNEVSLEKQYYISSHAFNDPKNQQAIRGHWDIENNLHWCLDIAFDEDHSRIRSKNAAHNMAIIRHIALNLLKQDKKTKAGLKAKRKKAGWSEKYLAQIIEFGQKS